LVRDRLYCDDFGSESHIQAQFTLDVIGTGLAKLLAPILPHLSTEFLKHHPQMKEELSNAMQRLLTLPEIPNDLLTSSKEAEQAVDFTQKLRSMLDENSPKKVDFPKAVIQIMVLI
jgi:isoleucyl-tRNA synthetase